jgi:hypothetical protein
MLLLRQICCQRQLADPQTCILLINLILFIYVASYDNNSFRQTYTFVTYGARGDVIWRAAA